MPPIREPLPALREGALASLRLRSVYDLANGAGLGLLFVASVLAAGNWRLLDQSRLLWLLVFLPLLHTLLMGLQQHLLVRACRNHFRRLFAETELLLIILSAEWPGQPMRGQATAAGNKLEFKRRLEAVQRRWQELLALAGSRPLPRAWWIQLWPYALGLGWATLAAYLRPEFGFHAITPPVVFLLIAVHDAAACQSAIARDVFLAELADELTASETEALRPGT